MDRNDGIVVALFCVFTLVFMGAFFEGCAKVVRAARVSDDRVQVGKCP